MNAKERKAHERFEQKEWKKKFSNWLLLEFDNSFILDEATITYSQVKIPKIVNEKKHYSYFDIIYSSSDSSNFHAVSLSELLNAINVGVDNQRFVYIRKDSDIVESYTYEEMIPLLDVSPFLFKFHFKNDKDRKQKYHFNKNDIHYSHYPKDAVRLDGTRLCELINLFGDFKNNKK